MKLDQVFERRCPLPVSAEEAYAWHARPGAFARLMPPWAPVECLVPPTSLDEGSEAVLRVSLGPIKKRWVARHSKPEPGVFFEDVQVSGPFARWVHRHSFEPADEGCVLVDHIDYRLPLGPLGALFGSIHARKDLERTFAHRHRIVAWDIARHAASGRENVMKIAVTGSTGLVGTQLLPFLTTGGHQVLRLVRGAASGADEVSWSPELGLEPDALAGVDAVVHLAGAGIADKRWNPKRKQLIRDSRVVGTRKLCEALAAMERKPEVLVCASAVGFYGERDEPVDESSPAGSGFLADTCAAWERATRPAREAGIRVVNLRFGVILSPKGGALKKMLLPFKMGGGGRLGSGEQPMAWIGLDDAVGAVHHALLTEELSGPVNVVAPEPATNASYTKTLGKVLRRPTVFPMPALVARMAFGEMAQELLLTGATVVPTELERTGYRFLTPDLESTLRHLLGKTKGGVASGVSHATGVPAST